MIGPGIRKLARERGMVCDGGFAYGRIGGRIIILDEGSGYKQLRVYLHPASENRDDADVLAALTDCDLKEFRLHMKDAVRIENGFARLVFYDTIGTMGRIIRYIDEILPRLDELGLNMNRCAYCGGDMGDDAAFAQLGGNILPMHSGCIPQLGTIVEEADISSRRGSIGKGILGAFIGALIGAALYALLFSMGRIAALAGLLTGRIASDLYDRFGGGRTKWKLLVVAVMLVLAVTLGQAAGYTVEFSRWYDETGYTADELTRAGYVQDCWEMFLIFDQETALGRQYDRHMADIPEAMRISREDHICMNYMRDIDTLRGEMRHEFAVNYRIGMLLGALGCLGVFMQDYSRNKKSEVRRLR